jgi:hypothetical protein
MILQRSLISGFVILSTNYSLSASSLAQTIPTYQHIVIDPHPSVSGSDTLEKVLVDIKGDGKLDAVLGEGQVRGGPGGLYWYENPRSGNLNDPWVKHTIAASGNFYEDIAAFDVNGDGAQDLVASVNGQLVWFENPRGHGGNPANPWISHVIRSDGGASHIILADIDGDGKTDVIASSSAIQGTSGAIMFQNSPDSWTEVRFGIAGETTAVLDIGSGHGAINIASGAGNNVVWYENPRETGGNARVGGWVQHVIAPFPSADEDTLASGVFSSSGRMDIIFAPNEDFSHTGLYRMIAPADRRSPWTVQTIDPTYQAVHKINVGDMNNDGRLDIVVAEEEQAHNSPPGFNQNFNRQRVTVLYNDGNANFTQQVIATTGSQNQTLGDIYGDGDLDILGANHNYFGAPNPLEIWVNQLNNRSVGGNLVHNPGFEASSSLTQWNVDGGPSAAGVDNTPSHAHSGNNCGFIWDGSGSKKFVDLSQTIIVSSNTNYTLTAWVDASNTTGGNIGIRTSGGANGATAAFVNTDPGPSTHAADYRQYTVTFNSGNNTSLVVFAGYTTPGGSSFINVDDVSITSNP